jgi:hypothetical protein
MACFVIITDLELAAGRGTRSWPSFFEAGREYSDPQTFLRTTTKRA